MVALSQRIYLRMARSRTVQHYYRSRLRRRVRFWGRFFAITAWNWGHVAAGISSVLFVPMSIQELTVKVTHYSWAAMMLIGGLLCILGVWRLNYRPQIIGLILTSSAAFFYTLALIPTWPNSRTASFLLFSFGCMQLSMLRQIRRQERADSRGRARSAGRLASDRSGRDSGSRLDYRSVFRSSAVLEEEARKERRERRIRRVTGNTDPGIALPAAYGDTGSGGNRPDHDDAHRKPEE